MEEWAKIEGFGNGDNRYYKVSNSGEVYSAYKQGILKPSLATGGYPRVHLRDKGGKSKHRYIHHLVAEYFVPNPHNLPNINHIDGDKTNNHYTNLEWCTQKHNIHTAIESGTFSVSKDRFKTSKTAVRLTPDQKQDIKDKVCSGRTKASVAREYDVSWRSISNIVKNTSGKPSSRYIFTDDEAMNIRKEKREGATNKELASKYKVKEVIIDRLVTYKTYRHVK